MYQMKQNGSYSQNPRVSDETKWRICSKLRVSNKTKWRIFLKSTYQMKQSLEKKSIFEVKESIHTFNFWLIIIIKI